MQTQYSTYRTLLAPVSGHGLSEAEAQDVLRQILPQLLTLHDRKQAHGSVSLDTVAYDYDRMQIILLDANGQNPQIYLAPEVLQTQQATPTADIYAIGVVIIVLLTGFPPEALRTSSNTWDWQELCSVSDQFMQILKTALSDEPAFRYNSAEQMLQSLQPIINSSESTITSPSDHREILLSPSPLPTNLPQNSSSIKTPLATESNSLGSSNSGINNSHKTKKIKVNFPNSQIYRKAKVTNKHQSKSNIKDLTRVLLTILLGGGVTFSGAVGAYFYMQSRAANDGSRSLEFTSSANQSMDQAIARIDKESKSDEDMDKLITLAKNKYETRGDLIESKMILKSIPSDSRMRSKADHLLAKWEQDLKKSNDLNLKAKKTTKDIKWKTVLDNVKGISLSSYWLPQDKKPVEETKQKLTNPDLPSPQTVAEPPTNLDPPYSPTAEIYTPPTETYTPPTESSNSTLPPAPRVAR